MNVHLQGSFPFIRVNIQGMCEDSDGNNGQLTSEDRDRVEKWSDTTGGLRL